VGSVDELSPSANELVVTVVAQQFQVLERVGPLERRQTIAAGYHSSNRDRVLHI